MFTSYLIFGMAKLPSTSGLKLAATIAAGIVVMFIILVAFRIIYLAVNKEDIDVESIFVEPFADFFDDDDDVDQMTTGAAKADEEEIEGEGGKGGEDETVEGGALDGADNDIDGGPAPL